MNDNITVLYNGYFVYIYSNIAEKFQLKNGDEITDKETFLNVMMEQGAEDLKRAQMAYQFINN